MWQSVLVSQRAALTFATKIQLTFNHRKRQLHFTRDPAVSHADELSATQPRRSRFFNVKKVYTREGKFAQIEPAQTLTLRLRTKLCKHLGNGTEIPFQKHRL